MKTTTAMTEKQRRAVEAMEAARSEGCTLTEYAQAQGLVIREIYDALACLRRKGLLPKSGRVRKSKFVAVQLTPSLPTAPPIAIKGGATGVLCRIVRADGYLIECLQWPEPRWLASLSSRTTDAAA